jgi:hypothetical protein
MNSTRASRFRGLIDSARLSRTFAPEWRLWIAAVLVAGLAQYSALALFVALAIGAVATWCSLNVDASRYLRPLVAGRASRSLRMLGFLARLILTASFFMTSMRVAALGLVGHEHRLPILIGYASLVGVTMTTMMVRYAWRLTSVFQCVAVTAIAGAVGLMWEAEPTPVLPLAPEQLIRNLLLTSVAFAAVRIYKLFQRHESSRTARWDRAWPQSLGLCAATAVALAPVESIRTSNEPFFRWIWLVAMILLITSTAINIAFGRYVVALDRRFLFDLFDGCRHRGRSAGIGVYTALSSIPIFASISSASSAQCVVQTALFILGGTLMSLSCRSLVIRRVLGRSDGDGDSTDDKSDTIDHHVAAGRQSA